MSKSYHSGVNSGEALQVGEQHASLPFASVKY